MEKVKIIARFLDGRVIKGFTQDFHPQKSAFHMFSTESSKGQESIEIHLRALKAVFFVHDFLGRPEYNERKHFSRGDRFSGRIVQVTFTDGEVLIGSTLGYDPKRPGFFLFPADPQTNNSRVFALSEAVQTVRYLGPPFCQFIEKEENERPRNDALPASAEKQNRVPLSAVAKP